MHHRPLSRRLDRGGGNSFFFILSGYLLARQADSGKADGSISGTAKMLAGRYGRLLPYMAPVFLALFALAHLGPSSLDVIIADLARSAYELLLLCMLGTIEACPLYNPPIWYCSALLICVALIFPMVRNHREASMRAIAPMVVILAYSYMILTFGDLDTIQDKVGIIYSGLLRGIAASCLGVCVYGLVKEQGRGAMQSLAAPLVASVALLGFVLVACAHSSIFDFLAAFAMAGMVYVAFGCSHLSGEFSSPIFSFMGRISLPIYVVQWVIVMLLSRMPGLQGELGTPAFIVLYLASCIGSALMLEAAVVLCRCVADKVMKGYRLHRS